MSNVNELVTEAVRLGGTLDDVSGQVFVKKTVKDDPQKFWIIAINFYGQEDLGRVASFIRRNNLQGFTEEVSRPPTVASKLEFTQPELAPICPIHNVPMKVSKKPGSYFCPKKDGDNYCKVTVKL